MSLQATKVLFATADPALRRTRGALMSNEGCEVMTSLSTLHAHQLIQYHAFDCLVLGSSLSSATCNELASRFRLRNPKGKVVEIAGYGDRAMDKPDARIIGNEELRKVFRSGMLQEPAWRAASQTAAVPPPPPGWITLQERAQRAKSTTELIGIIEEMNSLLDDYESSSDDGVILYATTRITKGARDVQSSD
jgi:DNA-binding NtrC family response regulator